MEKPEAGAWWVGPWERSLPLLPKCCVPPILTVLGSSLLTLSPCCLCHFTGVHIAGASGPPQFIFCVTWAPHS